MPEEVLAVRQQVREIRTTPEVMRYLAEVVRATRTAPQVQLGASPRAGVHLLLIGKTLAAMDGRDYLIPDDVKSAARPVLRHRLVVKPEADIEGVTADRVVEEVLSAVEVPK